MKPQSKPQRAPVTQIGEYALPHTVGAHLPTPGKAPGWPMVNIGQWRIDVNGAVPVWLAEMKVWRHEHLIRMGYDDSEYRRPEFAWTQKNFVHTQMMVEDRYFYDPVAGKYTVDKYLDDLERRFGGVDSVLIWYVYTNIGIDDRNQTALASDLPGGLEGLKQAVADFHRRGVKVFLPTMAWDNGTKGEGVPDWEAVAKLAKLVGADGVNGDTYNGVPRSFRVASEAIGHPLAFQPESVPYADEQLMWNNQSWGKASTEIIPAVSKLKWLEPRHVINIENRWARDRTDDFHYMFFNGIGYVAWENVWGVWNQFTARDGEALRRLATLLRKFSDLFVSLEWEPYALTLQQGVFASKFPSPAKTLWSIVNRNEYDMTGEQLVVPHREGRTYYDIWNGTRLSPRIVDGQAYISLTLETRGYGAVLGVESGATVDGLDALLAQMKKYNEVSLQSLSNVWQAIPQKMIEIEPTPPTKLAPEGMVTIPAAEFDFAVGGIEIEGYTWKGLDFQYPWENSARRSHRHRMHIKSFHIDKYPVTNAQFKKFMDASGYRPKDAHNFLRDWVDGAPRKGWEKKPVTWVSIEDARAYAQWAGKRLPHEWEWQYAAQGTDGRLYPWGNDWNTSNMPPQSKDREMPAPADVDAHPQGASPFGVMDLVGNVWQWTSEFYDEHTRAAALRGGSAYQPQTSHWYFPQAYQLDQHGKYLLMAPSKDRAGMLGFRCVVDAG
ncbi:MAG TPA: SUMF1/EgtB/PvdO family nonheme iron enzyme [Steroidobacter sp.]|uniref:formylglycine-generating enzyme family protein n=1 Tax=Steroidobacter sp. TaxID=1978227 RepID=UPI002ED8BC17